MKNNSVYLLAVLLLAGCDYTDFTEIKTTESDFINSDSVIAKSATVKSSIPMLAVLINYNNIKIDSSDTLWSEKLFGEADNQLNHYYMEVSNNRFKYSKAQESSGVVNDGVASVFLDKNHPDANVDRYGFEQRVYPDFKTSLELLDQFLDFSSFDENEDSFITPDELIITFITAGYEDAYEGRHVTYGIWGHQSCLSSDVGSVVLDRVSLLNCEHNGNFAVFGEKHNSAEPHDATIGIIAHELGHSTFNLPDLYNTYNPNSGGIGFFGIMGSGTWATKDEVEYAGNTPTHFSAWSKVYNNWIEPIEQKSNATLYESASAQYNIVKIPIDTDSYYLLENRNNSGYDRSLHSLGGVFDGGIAIWKIDETKLTKNYIDENSVNSDTANKGVDLVEAVDGDIDYYGDGGNENALYYEGNKNSFSTLITNISQRGSAMTLNIH
ncbi:MAG: M6 family metalloprotease domain-containing protein [Campylobacterota bacterium]|nr:M6 family metalloprotease domain-containing protein [Campylobacterota bacterium]